MEVNKRWMIVAGDANKERRNIRFADSSDSDSDLEPPGTTALSLQAQQRAKEVRSHHVHSTQVFSFIMNRGTPLCFLTEFTWGHWLFNSIHTSFITCAGFKDMYYKRSFIRHVLMVSSHWSNQIIIISNKNYWNSNGITLLFLYKRLFWREQRLIKYAQFQLSLKFHETNNTAYTS